MKLIFILLLLVSNLFAADYCATELLHDDYGMPETIKILSNTGVEFSPDKVAIWEKHYNYKLEEECIEMMDAMTILTPSGRIYNAFLTNDDICDGGNVFGIIVDLNNNIVMKVSDSFNYCPNSI